MRRNLRQTIKKPVATKFELQDYDNHNLSKRIARLPQLANRRAMDAVCQMLKTGKLADEDTVDVDWQMVDGSRQQMANEVWQQRKLFSKKIRRRENIELIKEIVTDRVERDCMIVTEDSISDKIDGYEGISRRLRGKPGEYEAVNQRVERVPTIDFGKDSKLK